MTKEDKNKKAQNLFLPGFGKWWDSLCLKGNPRNTSALDFLTIKAAKSGQTLEQYITTNDIEMVPIRVDAISIAWMGMGIAYRNFSKISKEFDYTVEVREYFGERALFGLVREYIITATGLKYNRKS